MAPCDKLNLGALGNSVRQLHAHVMVRCESDAAYAEATLLERLATLRQALEAAA